MNTNKFIGAVARAHGLDYNRIFTQVSEKTGKRRCKLWSVIGGDAGLLKFCQVVETALPHAVVEIVPGYRFSIAVYY